MKTPTVLLAVAFLASSCGALFYRTDSPCDFSDVTLDEEVISKVIGQLPETVEYARQGYSQVLPGLELAGLTVHGLNKLRQFGPAIPYCTNGTRMVQVELYSDGDTHCLSSWRICSGDEGRITIRARFARLTAQFRVVNSVAAGLKLEYDSALPTLTQNVFFGVEGAGHGIRTLFDVLSYLLPSFVEQMWSIAFFPSLEKGFRMINE